MKSVVCPELPTASLGSSQATTDAVDNSASFVNRPQPTYKSGKVVQTTGATSVGTLAVVNYAQPQGNTYALTLAFTTFVLFQFFNVFNARTEQGTTFNQQFFRNGKLWAVLGGVLALQALVVHWPPAQVVFDTTGLSALDWGLAFLVASSILWLDEAQKSGAMLLQRSQRSHSRVT